MKKNRTAKLPDGRLVMITKEELPEVGRQRRASFGAGHGLTAVLRGMEVGEVAKVPPPVGFDGRLVTAVRGVVANYERIHGCKFQMRSVKERVWIKRMGSDRR